MTRLAGIAALAVGAWLLATVPAHAAMCDSDSWGGRAAAIDPNGSLAATITAQTNLFHFGSQNAHIFCHGDFYAKAKLISGFGPTCESGNASTHHTTLGEGSLVMIQKYCGSLTCDRYYDGGGIHSGFGDSDYFSESTNSVYFSCSPPRTPQEECEGPPPLGEWYNDMCNYYSPIIIPTNNGQSYKLTSPSDGVWFDLDGDGVRDHVAWTESDSSLAFLAIDRDGDGQITTGKELFGNNTLPGVANGFDALAGLMPHNGDGAIDANDDLFPRLLLWTDRNHNGVSEPGELQPVSNIVTRIGLDHRPFKRRDGDGNVFFSRGWAEVRTAPGRQPAASTEHPSRLITIYDVILASAK